MRKTVLEYLTQSNLNHDMGPDSYKKLKGFLKRWDIQKPIAIYTNGDKRVELAVSKIKSIIGNNVFEKVDNEETVKNRCRGIITSLGTAMGNPNNPTSPPKGHVSNAPTTTNWFDHTKSSGEISAIVYLNLDSDQYKADDTIALHELGHAMGLFEHFDGFSSEGEAWSAEAEKVLKTLYCNELLSRKENLKAVPSGTTNTEH